ncbi:TetR family transcriptional regulator [Peribacillus asahii]|uniref:TetR family transcriptional regulator n=1 Tax=Peribacillus asahii TaxID=228899 RepID=UPI002079F880|nr:TetR family transcriptional regulator [Peribacillus asahii]USK69884.1 TetR family transcriptional regulator [Peribacillus asahii]
MIFSHLSEGIQIDKKIRIITAAIKMFQTHGFEKTKISDIVKEAGVAQGTFYLYFRSKFSIMPAIAEVIVEKMITEVEQKVNTNLFSKDLETLVEVVFNLTKKYRDILALIYAGLASSEHLKEWESIYTPYYSWMQDFLSRGIASGEVRDTIDTEYYAKLILGLIESAAEQVYLYDNHENEGIINKQKQEVLSFLASALKP